MIKQITTIQLTTEFEDDTIHKQVVSVLLKDLDILSKSGVLPVQMLIVDKPEEDKYKLIEISWKQEEA